MAFVHRYLVLAALGALPAFACSGKSSSPSGPSDAGDGGSGNASSGGSSFGGDGSSTGGDSGGGASGTGGSSTGGAASGGTDSPGGSGGTSDAGTPGSGGAAGASSGGNGANAGNAGAGSGGLGGMPSVGCNSAQVPTSGRFTIRVDGTDREYIVKLPDGYDVTRPRTHRLIFAFHGAMYSAQTVADGGPPGSGPYYGIEALAGGSAIFVAPQALTGSWTNQGGRDAAYVNAMVTRLRSELCVDQTRIFATGFSMGAIMTITMGCTSDGTFRAIAPMSGSLPSTCDGDRALAYWASHGTNDMTITEARGMAARDAFLEKNGCSTTSVPGDRAGCVNYEGCDAGAPVTWCTFTGVHEPPLYAGEAIWNFFSRF